MTLDAFEFIRRFLQHVLPAGFQKVRHYGFLSPNGGLSIDAVRWLITLSTGVLFTLSSQKERPTFAAPTPCCPECGGRLLVRGFLPAIVPFVYDTS